MLLLIFLQMLSVTDLIITTRPQIRKQTEKIVSIVKKTKDHPAVLMWAIGNELDFVPPLEPFNPRVWDAVNQAARAIHAVDPNHPVYDSYRHKYDGQGS